MKLQLKKKLIREMMHLKLQVFSIAMVVGIGVAVMFGFSSTYESLKTSRDVFYQSSGFSDIFLRTKKAPSSVSHQLEKLEGVVRVETRLEYDALLSLPDMVEPAVGHLISIPDGRQPEMNQLSLLQGRLPTELSTEEIVVSEGFFKAREFRLGDQFSASLNGKRRELTIVGVGVTPEHVLALQPGSPMPDDNHFTLIWINESVLKASYDMRAAFNSAVIKTQPGVLTEAIISKIDKILDKYGGVGAYGRDKQGSYVYVREELKQLQVQAMTIPVVFFLVAAFILNVVMSRMIRSQRGEIATLKALGFHNFEISSYYYQIALTIVGLGAIFGLIVGAWIGSTMIDLYAKYYHFPTLTYDFSITHFLTALAVSFGTAAVGVYSSLKKIFKLSPAEAMRPPTPHNFHHSLIERATWFRALRTRQRMMLRGVLSFPGKSLMTGLGLCFSVVILISGLFWNDSMDFLLLAQYSFAQKETGSIQLTHALSSKAVFEVARLPGVIEAEGYRNTPVKVTYQTREQKTVMKGLPDSPRLIGLVNEELQELPIPETGILISRILANQLNVEVGDVVDVEVTEGRKPKFSLKVEKIFEGLMNTEILTSRAVLADILNTDDLVDQVLFRSYSDPTVLYAKLKEMPNVLSISYRDSIVAFFKDNAAKFILVFAFILSVFAGAIGFGVAFNSMRVALAERDWELSTLQILGFTTFEVFQLIMGEILLLLIAFLPLGWLLGYLMSGAYIDAMTMESFRIPFVIEPATFFFATVILVLSTILSGWVIYRIISNSDMVATLKSRG